VYGLGAEPQTLSVRRDDLQDAIRSEAGLNVLLDLVVIDGKEKNSHLVMIKELQRHPFKDRLLHVDFLRVARDEKVSMKVPIAIRGEEESLGLKAGGTMQHNLWELEVECLPTEVPDHIYADIREIQIGEHLSVGELEIPQGVTVLSDAEDVVLTVLAPRLVEEEAPVAEEEAAAEEEVAVSAEEAPAEEAAAPEGGKEE
jgi:large subunit ribosomal protein L25